MKLIVNIFLLALALTTGAWVKSQASEQSNAAFERKDYRTAFAGYKKLAEQGNAYAQYNLGIMYNKGQGVPRDAQQAAAWFRRSAEKGFAQAQFNLGAMYAGGEGVTQDDPLAVGWYRKAAEQGHAGAQYNLGVKYDNGLGVAKDVEQAVAWFRKAAEQGLAEAQVRMAQKYDWGQGVSKDKEQALAWYSKAADQGNADAQNTLGSWFYIGVDVPRDAMQAAAWYRKAAQQGNASGQNSLGSMYLEGYGFPKDDQQAIAWISRAAEQGHAMAQHNLGLQYAKGEGVPKDPQMSYFWWLLASASGNSDTLRLRNAVESILSPEQRAAAQANARNWRPKSAAQSLRASGPSAGTDSGESTPSRLSTSPPQADSTGSGFRIARGVIITNHHVVDGCSRLSVNGVSAKLRGSDARSDLALINIALAGTNANLRAQRAAVGEPVAVAGFPLRGLLSGFNMTTGNLSSLSGAGGDTRLIQISAPVQPGNSGGPALDSAGNVLGVVVSKLDAIKTAKITGDIPQNVNFAISANILRSFLDANSVNYETGSSDKPLLSTAIAEKAKGFTVLVECWK